MGQHRCEPWRRAVPALVASPPRSMQRAEHKQAGRLAGSGRNFVFFFFFLFFNRTFQEFTEFAEKILEKLKSYQWSK